MSRQFVKQYPGQGALKEPVRGIMLDWGTTVPSDGAKGYCNGCLFIDDDATVSGTFLYINEGTTSSCDFNAYTGGLTTTQMIALATLTSTETALLSGLLATAAEINRNNQISTREVLAGATLTLSAALHDGKTIAMPAVCAITLPASSGSGVRFKLYQKIAATAVTITAAAADLYGVAWALSDNSAAVLGYEAAGATVITFDGSTKGGRKGHIVELEDVATNLWLVRSMGAATGTEATPFS